MTKFEGSPLDQGSGGFYSAATLLAMQSAVLDTSIPSVRLSHADTLSRRMKIESRGLDCEVAQTL